MIHTAAETITIPRTETESDRSLIKLTGNLTEPIFQPITDADLPAINQMLQHSSTRTCDYTIGGIFMWIKYFGYEYCVLNDTLFIKGRSENNREQTAFSLPIGAMPLGESVRLLRNYCEARRMPLIFSAIPEDRVDALAAETGGRIELLEGWADYLYDIKALATFSGKKLAKKRNHVNRFIQDNPDYVFRPLTAELIPELQLFCAGRDLEEKADARMAAYELQQCMKVLRNYSSYPFEGAVLCTGAGEICAFAIGEVIGDTLYVHIEKMNHDIAGAGEAIVNFFAAYMLNRHPSLRFENREEDMGDPGLRYAKETYRPVALLNKYNVIC